MGAGSVQSVGDRRRRGGPFDEDVGHLRAAEFGRGPLAFGQKLPHLGATEEDLISLDLGECLGGPQPLILWLTEPC